ncbi:MAG: type II toxin-antitoxin system RelE/ParE family toxin [Cyclobacteriaceae bacterium]|nr:type II toxin-antitoxin system RelE/ParE family toxin [Cyclobacteriaceae bacterium]
MEKEIVVTKRFRNHTHRVYQYLVKNFSSKTAFLFLEKIEERIGLIAKYPSIGRQSNKKVDIKSIQLIPHNLIFYRVKKSRIEILCLFDTRQNPRKKPY